MATKRVLAIGLVRVASEAVDHQTFSARVSLLDYDIVLYRPDISEFVEYSDEYNGKPCLNDRQSILLREAAEHWRSEILQAAEDGKTVIAWLPTIDTVYVATGRKEYSGTGRNQKTTRLVEEFNYLKSIPVELKARNSSGKILRVAEGFGPLLNSYLDSFAQFSEFQVILDVAKAKICITTKSNNFAVGALIRSKNNGTLLLLPDLEFYNPSFTKKARDGKEVWSPAGLDFSRRLVDFILEFHKQTTGSSEFTPTPLWAEEPRFDLSGEPELRSALLMAERAIEDAQRTREKIKDELSAAGRFRALLFEKGKPLENAVLEALQVLGFSVEQYKEGGSEFDVVFESPEGRLIGEVEGKDTKAINVDKLRQLSMNIHEDLQRESVSTPAKAVLFGNAFRLSPPESRGEPFTDKCVSASSTSSTCLVCTVDLFGVVQHLLKVPDSSFASDCRKAILNGVGRVKFPVSNADMSQEAVQSASKAE